MTLRPALKTWRRLADHPSRGRARSDRGLRDTALRLRATHGGRSASASSRSIAAVAAVAAIAAVSLLCACGGEDVLPPRRSDTAAVVEAVTLHTPTGDLRGTLVLPEAARPVPAVIILAGSGPTDRNGNNPPLLATDAYRMLADSLSAHGIASLRYDKRGTAASAAAGKREEDGRFDDFVADAAAWVQLLDADSRIGKIAVAGHSEGALVGMLAAERGGVAAVVTLAGAGRRVNEIIALQLRDAQPPLPPAVIATSDSLLNVLAAGRLLGGIPNDMPLDVWFGLFRPSVQPYLISLFAHDPVAVMARLKALQLRVQVVHGTRDLNIPLADAGFLAAAAGVDAVIVEGMNHVLKLSPADRAGNEATYSQPSLPVPAALVTPLVAFLSSSLK